MKPLAALSNCFDNFFILVLISKRFLIGVIYELFFSGGRKGL